MGFDAVAQVQAGAGVDGVGVVEDLAEFVEGGGMAELERSLAALPAEQVRALLEAMATNPTLLRENNLAELASILGRRTLGS